MSIEHFRAAWKCRQFRGSTRLLLLALANRASNGKPSKLSNRAYPAGWSFAGSARLMMDTAIQSRDTLIASMKELLDSKVIQRKRRLGRTTLTFVDLDVLISLAYTEEDKEEYRQRAEAYTKKCLSSTTELSEETLPLDVGNTPTCDAGDSATSIVGNRPTTDAGKTGADNPQGYPKVLSPKADYHPASESASADAETDDNLVGEEPTGGTGENYEEPASDPAEVSPVLADEESCSHQPSVEPPSPSFAAPLPAGREPDPQEYADVVYLCSLWRATHEREAVPESQLPDADDPVNWTTDRRRRTFRAVVEREAKESSPLPEVPSPDVSEDELWYQDEEAMLQLYLEHGREDIEKVIRWLPCANFWSTPQNKPESIAALSRAWSLVYRDCEKYFNRASETGTSEQCDLYVQKRFDVAGGTWADRICDDRLNPVDPQDAADEAAVDAFDDQLGVDVGFYPDLFITFPPGYNFDKYVTTSTDTAVDPVPSSALEFEGDANKR